MNQTDASGSGESSTVQWFVRPGQPRLVYCRSEGTGPGTVFLGGLASDMTGTKATALETAARHAGRAFLRFDYRGHGQSEGQFIESTMGDWLADAMAAFDTLTEGPQILVGSSMGGWVALMLAEARPDRVKALVGVAAAPDFTEDLVWKGLSEPERATMMRDGVLYQPSQYGAPTPMTLALVEEGRRHLMLHRQIAFAGPVRLLHGQRDPDVPWETSLRTAVALMSNDVRTVFVKDGDHRLSRPQDIDLLVRTVDELARI